MAAALLCYRAGGACRCGRREQGRTLHPAQDVQILKGAMLRMVTATVIAVSVLGVCAAWCCGRDAGWREATRADAHRLGVYKDWVWHLAEKSRDLNDFKARYAVAMTLDEGEADDGQ